VECLSAFGPTRHGRWHGATIVRTPAGVLRIQVQSCRRRLLAVLGCRDAVFTTGVDLGAFRLPRFITRRDLFLMNARFRLPLEVTLKLTALDTRLEEHAGNVNGHQ
jgi:hypothetical protein